MTTSQSFAHLLVPLDGSRLAEAVLPATESLALHFASRITLIHVLEKRPPATVHGDRHLATLNEGETYLAEIAGRLHSKGLAVDIHVHPAPEGDLPGSVVEHSEEFAPDLVILCAHGGGGLRGFLFGSIAEQVMQRGARPVLLIQPAPDGSAPPFTLRRILVPLDGNAEHESAVSLAGGLARAYRSELELVYVVPTLQTLSGNRAASAVWLPATTRELLDLDQKHAADYLKTVAEPYLAQGVAVQPEVLRGDTVTELLQHAQDVGADLIALTSHGRTGLRALFNGSVGPRISSQFDKPLLLVRV